MIEIQHPHSGRDLRVATGHMIPLHPSPGGIHPRSGKDRSRDLPTPVVDPDTSERGGGGKKHEI